MNYVVYIIKYIVFAVLIYLALTAIPKFKLSTEEKVVIIVAIVIATGLSDIGGIFFMKIAHRLCGCEPCTKNVVVVQPQTTAPPA